MCPRSKTAVGTTFSTARDKDTWYKPVKVDRVLHDGDEVKLGDAVLVAHLTPGHTKGCTTWTMKTQEGGKTYNVVIVGSPNVNAGLQAGEECRLSADRAGLRTHVPGIEVPAVRHLPRRARRLLRHAEKVATKKGFVDPEGYKAYVAEREAAFRRELKKQQEN